jgi:hypothetical protein
VSAEPSCWIGWVWVCTLGGGYRIPRGKVTAAAMLSGVGVALCSHGGLGMVGRRHASRQRSGMWPVMSQTRRARCRVSI